MIKCALYDGMRKGQHLYYTYRKAHGMDHIIYQETLQIDGFSMYDMFNYPIIKLSLDCITVDLMELSPAMHYIIKSYNENLKNEEQVISINGEWYYIYVHSNEMSPMLDKVDDGDWSSVFGGTN